MKIFLRARLEAWWILMAIRILRGRNVTRSMVVSRRDNNEMWSMSEHLEGIERRIRNGYNDPADNEPG